MDRFILANLAAFFKPPADGLADVGGFRVGQGRYGHTEFIVDGAEKIVALEIEVGNLPDDLVIIALKKRRGSVFALQLESLGRVAFTEEGRDLAIAGVFLTHGSQDFRQREFRQNAAQELDRVAGLDRLALLAVAQHFDGHAGFRLQLQQLQHGAWGDLADFVDNEHGLFGGLKLSRINGS